MRESLGVRAGRFAVAVERGPSNDKIEALELLAKVSGVNRTQLVIADAGYDAEWIHEYCREE